MAAIVTNLLAISFRIPELRFSDIINSIRVVIRLCHSLDIKSAQFKEVQYEDNILRMVVEVMLVAKESLIQSDSVLKKHYVSLMISKGSWLFQLLKIPPVDE